MANIKNISMPDTVNNNRCIAINGLYSLFEAKRAPEFYFSGESHSAWEMVYICDGSAGVTADDKVYKLTAGDVIFHHPMQFHKIWSEDGESLRIFIASFFLEGGLTYKLKAGVFRLNDRQSQIINIIISHLRRRFDIDPALTDEIDYLGKFRLTPEPLVQLIMTLLEALMADLALSNDKSIPAVNGENERLYTQIAGILESNVNTPVTIAEIAEMCNVSSATVKNCFSAFAGCGIHKYHLKIKMRNAAELLRSGKTVSEVSDILGFANPNYFSYVFKRETGKCASSFKR